MDNSTFPVTAGMLSLTVTGYPLSVFQHIRNEGEPGRKSTVFDRHSWQREYRPYAGLQQLVIAHWHCGGRQRLGDDFGYRRSGATYYLVEAAWAFESAAPSSQRMGPLVGCRLIAVRPCVDWVEQPSL